MSEKRYYWLKLKEDFFTSRRVKKLRKMAGGAVYTIIYLKLQLLTLKNDGVYKYAGIEDNVAKELALDLDESPEDIAVTLQYLQSVGLLESSNGSDFFLPWVIENTGSETGDASRKREARRQAKIGQTADEVRTLSEHCPENVPLEIRDKRLELRDKNITKRRFTPPSREEVSQYCTERGNNIDPDAFIDFYESKGWRVGNQSMKDWKAAVRTWEQRRKKEGQEKEQKQKSSVERIQEKLDKMWEEMDDESRV